MHSNLDRANAVYAAMQANLYVSDGTSLYRETAPPSGPTYANLWPFSRALVGTLALAGTPGGDRYVADVRDRMSGLERYWDRLTWTPAYASSVPGFFGGGGDKYYDDNAWVSLALIQHHRMGFGTSLRRAEQLWKFAQKGWDTDRRARILGGVFWVQQRTGAGLTNHDRGTGATAGYAELGFHLHELSGSDAYDGDGEPEARPRSLGALNMVNWVARHVDRSQTGEGPFWNVARPDGGIDRNLWSYNQGVMLGARVLQYRLTHDPAFLGLAESIARQTLATFGEFTSHPPSFNAMCFQNMLMLCAESSDTDLTSAMHARMAAYADWAWEPATGARDPATNLFYFTDAGHPASGRQPARLQDQGAMVQLYALLEWSPADYRKLT
ncbi:MAG: glycosyl hydrolase [Chloroflexi bacterium]|nr:glycosyl hydrolase [Chloroflexota bacterium]